MSIDQLLAYAEEPSLREIAQFWDRARGNRRCPAWRDIDPVALAPHLPILWAWRWDKAEQTFIGRLAGEAILDALGPGLRGTRLLDFFAGPRGHVVMGRYRRVLEQPAFMCNQGAVFSLHGGVGVGERIVMPLAEDGIHPDGILGATVYRLNGSRGRERLRSSELQSVEFFPI